LDYFEDRQRKSRSSLRELQVQLFVRFAYSERLKLSLGNSLEWETLENLPTIPGLDNRTFEELIGTDIANVIPWTPESSGTPLSNFTEEFKPAAHQVTPQNYVQDITDRVRSLTADIERLGTEQKRITTPVPKEVISSFEGAYKELKVRMQEEHAKLTVRHSSLYKNITNFRL
jgi:hypothetical protein